MNEQIYKSIQPELMNKWTNNLLTYCPSNQLTNQPTKQPSKQTKKQKTAFETIIENAFLCIRTYQNNNLSWKMNWKMYIPLTVAVMIAALKLHKLPKLYCQKCSY